MNEKNETKENINKKYEFFDVTADVGYLAYGNSLEEVYENSALAMFDVITDVNKVSKKELKRFSIESEDLISLLYDFLEELLFIHEVELFFFSGFDVKIEEKFTNNIKSYHLESLAFGEKIDWNIHERRSEVKAITFHMMKIFDENNLKARVILDL